MSSIDAHQVRTICAGEEILDNYGYHYAVMPREERQRKLQSQYYFSCACVSCRCPEPNIMLNLINKPPLQRQLASLHRSCHGRGAPRWHPT